MKILFLDDDENRHRKFRRCMIGQPFTVVSTADDAIGELTEESFNIVSLDHDLRGGV